jgi:hypothetical protein
MAHFRTFLLAALSLMTIGVSSAYADYSEQALTGIDFDVSFPALPSVKGHLNVSVIKDSTGKLEYLRLGPGTYTQNDNGKITNESIPDTVISVDQLKKIGKYDFSFDTPVFGKRTILGFDASKLDPVKGGPLGIKYFGDELFGSTHDVPLYLSNEKGTWIAWDQETKSKPTSGRRGNTYYYVYAPLKTITVKSGVGFMLNSPDYTKLNPNEIAGMKSTPIDSEKIYVSDINDAIELTGGKRTDTKASPPVASAAAAAH